MIEVTNADIGARLKKARVKAGVSQAALAAKLGLSPQAVAKYEAGRGTIPALQLVRAARALGCDAGGLLPKARRGARARPSRAETGRPVGS